MFYCVFTTFTCGVLGKVWCLLVSVPDLCLLSYVDLQSEIIDNILISIYHGEVWKYSRAMSI